MNQWSSLLAAKRLGEFRHVGHHVVDADDFRVARALEQPIRRPLELSPDFLLTLSELQLQLRSALGLVAER